MVNEMYRDDQNYGDLGYKSKNNLDDGEYDDGIDNFDFDNEQSVSFHDTLIQEDFKAPNKQTKQTKQNVKS